MFWKKEGLVKILLDQDDRTNKFCPIICVFAWSYDRWSSYKWLWNLLYFKDNIGDRLDYAAKLGNEVTDLNAENESW